jgi:hypothetical protein
MRYRPVNSELRSQGIGADGREQGVIENIEYRLQNVEF